MKMKYLRYLPCIIILTVMAGCDDFGSFKVTDKPYVNQTSVELYVGEDAGDMGSVQLTTSPAGAGYEWTSLNTSVATVDQTGLIKAVGEGMTSVVLASKDDQTNIDVRVKPYIALTDFTLSTELIIGYWQLMTKVYTTIAPENATNSNIEWTSSNGNVAVVYSNGMVKTMDYGRATVTAKAGGFTKTIDVLVPEKMSKEGWSIPGYNPDSDLGTIGYSSQATNEGDKNKIVAILDDDLETFWHARWGGSGGTDYPHWFIVDLGKDVSLAQVSMTRRLGNNNVQKGYQILTCNESGATDLGDPTVWAWEDQGEYSFDPDTNDAQIQAIMKVPTARYIKVYMDTKFKGRGNYAMLADFSVYVVD